MVMLQLRSRQWIVDEQGHIIIGEGRQEILENIEKTGASFFPRTALPKISGLRNSQEQIEMCFDYIENDGPEVLFD